LFTGIHEASFPFSSKQRGCTAGAEAVIPSKRNRTTPREHDRDMYGWRHLVENLLAGAREFRAITTRHDRTDESLAAGIHPVADVVAMS